MKYILILVLASFILACSGNRSSKEGDGKYADITNFNPADTLVRIPLNGYELGEEFCYINQKGDTVIPYGRYDLSFSDTIISFGIVVEKIGKKQELIGINQQLERLYEVHWFDNGPDYIEEGLFRIIRNDLIGYADATGKIIIDPQFSCAYPFSEGKAKVANDCNFEKQDEHTEMISTNWFYIDKKGEKIN